LNTAAGITPAACFEDLQFDRIFDEIIFVVLSVRDMMTFHFNCVKQQKKYNNQARNIANILLKIRVWLRLKKNN